MKNFKPSWAQYVNAIKVLAKRLQGPALPSYDAIVGISRGGLVAATILSHMLSTKNKQLPVYSVSISSYRGKKRSRVSTPVGYIPDARRILLVDDIVSSGKTMIAATKYIMQQKAGASVSQRSLTLAAVYVISVEKDRCFYGMVVDDNAWVVFPYEVE